MTRQKLPSISGNRLIRLLEKDGWQQKRKATHGIALAKRFGDRNRVTVVPSKNGSLPEGTLMDILSPQQTGLGKEGLRALIGKK